jgi:hypothetical protein
LNSSADSFGSIKNDTGKKEAIKQATLSKHMFSSASDKPNPTKKKKLMGISGTSENLPDVQSKLYCLIEGAN